MWQMITRFRTVMHRSLDAMTVNIHSPAGIERRENPRLRDVFVRSCELLAPFVAQNDNVKTFSNFAMAHVLTAHFTQLSSAEIHIIILTVEKLHKQNRLHLLTAQPDKAC